MKQSCGRRRPPAPAFNLPKNSFDAQVLRLYSSAEFSAQQDAWESPQPRSKLLEHSAGARTIAGEVTPDPCEDQHENAATPEPQEARRDPHTGKPQDRAFTYGASTVTATAKCRPTAKSTPGTV